MSKLIGVKYSKDNIWFIKETNEEYKNNKGERLFKVTAGYLNQKEPNSIISDDGPYYLLSSHKFNGGYGVAVSDNEVRSLYSGNKRRQSLYFKFDPRLMCIVEVRFKIGTDFNDKDVTDNRVNVVNASVSTFGIFRDGNNNIVTEPVYKVMGLRKLNLISFNLIRRSLYRFGCVSFLPDISVFEYV